MSTVPGSSSEKPIKIKQKPNFSEKQLSQIYDVTPITDGDDLALGNKFLVACNICKLRVGSKVDPRLQDCVICQDHAQMHIERECSVGQELELVLRKAKEESLKSGIKRTILSSALRKAKEENLKSDIKRTILSDREENLKTICEPEPGLVDTLEDNKDDHSTNTLFSDTPESKQPGGNGGLREGYVMVCWLCGSEKCGSGVYHPVRMLCYVCHEHGKHSSWNCPTGRYRGPPMPERYGCSNWDDE